jgi:hypothetical protein
VNIKSFKVLVANLPDEITAEQFGMIELDYEELLAEQRQADEAELATTLARVAKLKEKLGQVAPLRPTQATPTNKQAERDLTGSHNGTDFDAGISYSDEAASAQSFTEELATLRQRSVERRRGRH